MGSFHYLEELSTLMLTVLTTSDESEAGLRQTLIPSVSDLSSFVKLESRRQTQARRSGMDKAYTKRWWGILSGGAQTAAIDCILGQDSPVTLQGQDPPLATVFQWGDLGPEPSRLR